MKQAIILAGGLGTRLKARLGDLPKPMIPIGDKPLLELQVELAKKHGFTDILIFACYRADLIEAHFGTGAKWGVHIRYVVEKTPLGTAGAVLDGFDSLAARFLVLYGDTMVNVDLTRVWNAHERANADATLLLHPNDHPLDSDLVEVDSSGWISAFHGRPHPPGHWFQNLVNAGLYVMEKEPLKKFLDPGRPLDFGKDIFPMMLQQGNKLMGYNSPEYIKDIGTPERYDRIVAEWRSGLVDRSSLEHPQRAVFLDRDGTLVVDMDNLCRPEDLVLLPGVAEAVHLLNHHGFRVIVVTNQPVIAKGFCTEATLAEIHKKMETLLGKEHAFLDRIYYCPHHPDRGFPGEVTELKIRCSCRKPETGMLESARQNMNLDLDQSWMVGDTTIDIQTAKNAGVKSVLVKTGAGGADGKYAVTPDFVRTDLLEAAHLIVEKSKLANKA